MSEATVQTKELSALQLKMLNDGDFQIDGWCTRRGKEAAAELEELGYVTGTVEVYDQYTIINYIVTDSGREALVRNKA